MHEKVRALHPAATPRQPDPSLPRLPAAHISRTRLTQALLAGDMNAVLGGTIVVGTCFVALNLLSDILYRVLDPRAG